MSNHKQASLYKKTHELLDEIVEKENEKWEAPAKKPSKATIIHELVAKHYAKVVKR